MTPQTDYIFFLQFFQSLFQKILINKYMMSVFVTGRNVSIFYFKNKNESQTCSDSFFTISLIINNFIKHLE